MESKDELGPYWRGTEGLLRRATAHCYRMIIAPASEGGLKEFLDEHCGTFAEVTEHSVRHWELYKEFEAKVDGALEGFLETEFEDPESRRANLDDLHAAIRRGMDDRASKKESMDSAVSLLVAAADFKKFCSIMRQRAKKKVKEPLKAEAKE